MEWTVVEMSSVLAVYAIIMVSLTWWLSKKTGVEDFIVANRNAHYGWAASTMSATWIWGASIFAAATAGYKYGISGAFHYAFWGGLGLVFFYPWAQRIRRIVPHGHTFPEFIRHRHGRMSQSLIGFENYVNAQYSLVLNFTAGASVISLFAPGINFDAALVIIAAIVVSYAVISGIKASLVTDVVQLAAMVLITIVVVPWLFFTIGGAEGIAERLTILTVPQQNVFSKDAFLLQGAPMAILMLAYSFGNPSVWQRVWVMRASVLKRSYISAGFMYMAIVFSIGLFGFVALLTGLTPADGNDNNLVPQVALVYLPMILALPLALLLVSALLSTTDSDLAALSSIAMTDLWKGAIHTKAGSRELLTVGRVTIVAAAAIAVWVASFQIDILTLILFYGMVRAALVFPVAASLVSSRITDAGFTAGVLGGAALGIVANLLAAPSAQGASFLSAHLWLGVPYTLLASLGAAGMIGCVAHPFLGRATVALGVVVILAVGALAFTHLDAMLTYKTLLASLSSLGGGMLLCLLVSYGQLRVFEWDGLARDIQPIAEEV